MPPANIILTGFMGTGKSTIGRALAERLDLTFVDTDQLIEERAGCTIAEIFAQQGERAFRQMEADLAQELAQQQGLVIATGGGFFTNPENIKALQTEGRIICLTAGAEEILKRVKQQGQVRPLLQHSNPLQQINDLLHQRKKVYQQFPQVVTDQQSSDQIVDTILDLLN